MKPRICAQNGIVHLVRIDSTMTLCGWTECDELFTYGLTYFATELRGRVVPQVTRVYGIPTCLWCMVAR